MRLALALVLLAASACQAQSWKIDYFYDKDRSSLYIADAAFLSATQAIAIGGIDEKDKRRPVIGRSSDAGKTWAFEPTKENPVSLFFLNETNGWMVTQKAILGSSDGGKTWKRLSPLGGMRKLHFLTAQHGFAVGAPKAAFETHDGGVNWIPIAAAQTPTSNPDHTTYDVIAFGNEKYGAIFGSAIPPRRGSVPEWMDPQRTAGVRQVPTLTLLLSTVDGGKTWTPSTAPLFGRPTVARMSPLGFGLLVFRYENQFEAPSEVYQMDLTGTSSKIGTLFKQKDRLITDALIRPDGSILMAGVEPPAQAPGVPIPVKVKILESKDRKTFTEMPVNYRASARRVFLSAVGDKVWAITDTGMVLRFQ